MLVLASTLAGAVIATAPAGAQTGAALPPLKATYNLNPPRAKVTTQITERDGIVSYRSKVFITGLLAKFFAGEAVTTSTARRDASGRLIPLEYDYTLTTRPDKAQHYRFDWARERARVQYKGKNYEVGLTAGVADENIMLLRLAEDVAASGPVFDATYQILSRGKIKLRRFTAAGKETIETVLGNIETVKVERYKRGELDRILWLSPQHHFLPVKVNKLEDGKVKQTMTLLELEFASGAPGQSER